MTSQNFGATRRTVLGLGAVLIGAGAAVAETAAPIKAPMGLLMAEPPLPDLWIGDAKAPITMIEYASLTCGHCARFAVEVFPILKKNYIDTGKLRYVLRDFPLDPLAAAGAMVARCAGDDKRQAMVELLFAQQKNWAFVNQPVDALRDLVKQTGMGEKAFEACLSDQKLFDKVNAARNFASEKFGIDATPTFFINGDKKSGEIPAADLDAVLAPYLPK